VRLKRSNGRLETKSVAVEVESAAGRRLGIFRDGLRERVARLLKRIFACEGLRVPVKELALGIDVQPRVRFRMLVAVDAVGFVLPLAAVSFRLKSCFDGIVLAVALGLFGRERRRLLFRFNSLWCCIVCSFGVWDCECRAGAS
jgi:hypothetical protein